MQKEKLRKGRLFLSNQAHVKDNGLETIEKFDNMVKNFWVEHAKGREMVNLGLENKEAYEDAFIQLDEILSFVSNDVEDIIILEMLSLRMDELIQEFHYKTLH